MDQHNQAHLHAGGSDRFTSGVSASGNAFPQQNNVMVGLQGYYPQDVQGYTDAACPSQAYQTLAYAGVSSPQPYWTFAPYGEGSANASHTNTQEMNMALRDRDVKTQRRKEANRESARRSKQRKKEESEILSSKAQDLVHESTTLRNDLEKMQKQADKLYSENMELRNQVRQAGGSLPPSPERIEHVKIPPPVELPPSLFKEANNSSNSTKKEDTTPKSSQQPIKSEPAKPNLSSIVRAGEDVLGQGEMDLPTLLENELANPQGVVNDDGFSNLPMPTNVGNVVYQHLGSGGDDESAGDMLMSEAIVSFKEPERVSLFTPSNGLDDVVCRSSMPSNISALDDMILGSNAHFPAVSMGETKAASRKVEGHINNTDNFHVMRRSDEVGQGG